MIFSVMAVGCGAVLRVPVLIAARQRQSGGTRDRRRLDGRPSSCVRQQCSVGSFRRSFRRSWLGGPGGRWPRRSSPDPAISRPVTGTALCRDHQRTAFVSSSNQLERHADFGLVLCNVGNIIENHQVDPVESGDGRRQLHGLSLQLAALDAIGCRVAGQLAALHARVAAWVLPWPEIWLPARLA